MSAYTVSMSSSHAAVGYQPVSSQAPPQYEMTAPVTNSYQPAAVSSNSTNVAVVSTAPMVQNVVFASGPPNYLVLNILALFFCCFLFGLIGLIYSMKVDSEWSAGNQAGAHEASRMARNWGYASIFTGVGIIAVSFAMFIIMIIVAFSTAAVE